MNLQFVTDYCVRTRMFAVGVAVHVLELESACLSGQVRPPLYRFDSTQPLSCLGSSVVRASA